MTSDKILSMGRTEKTMIGLGYQGDTSSLQTIFVRSTSSEPNETRVVLGDESSFIGRMDNADQKFVRLGDQTISGPENGLNNVLIVSRIRTRTIDINLNTTPYMCGTTMEAFSPRLGIITSKPCKGVVEFIRIWMQLIYGSVILCK